MSPFVTFLVINLVGAALFLAIFLPIFLIRKRYEKIVLEHSVTLRQVNEITGKYSFYFIPNFNMDHVYDNRDYYYTISPEDFLIYELAFIQKDVRDACKNAEANKREFEACTKEIVEKVKLGVYDTEVNVLFEKTLNKIEEKIITKAFPRPRIEFSIFVSIRFRSVNGRYRASKGDTFSAPEIIELIKRINRKRGSFYLDRDIYEAICRVERGKVSNHMRFAIYARDGYRCCNCGSPHNLEIDHIIPISKGGKSTMNNLQTLCHRCNTMKGNSLDW